MKLRVIVLLLIISFSGMSILAQQVNTLYFLENNPLRHQLNVAQQPLSAFYFNLPVIGYTDFSVGSNALKVSKLTLSKEDFLLSMPSSTLVQTALNTNLFGFGFRAKSSYLTVGISSKTSVKLGVPSDLFKILLFGNVNYSNGIPQLTGNAFDFSNFSAFGLSYIEAALGYSKLIDEKLTLGIKLKYLHGLATMNGRFSNFTADTGIDQWKIEANASIDYAYPDPNNFSVSSLVNPLGMGGAVDLGVVYKPIERLALGASVNDVGFIRWNKKPSNLAVDYNVNLTGLQHTNLNDILNGNVTDGYVDTLLTDLRNGISHTTSQNIFTTNLSPTLNLSAEYHLYKQFLSVGLLSTTQFYNNKLYTDVTTSLNIKPINWFNMSLSYSLFNGNASNVGAGIGFRLGFVNIFASADFISLNNTPLTNPLVIDATAIPLVGAAISPITISKVPYNTNMMNFAIGVNFVFGNKIDADNDGVSNRRDKCPFTPIGVIVDKKGCPLDTDGDGVPDYYDKCPNTPKEAFKTIDADGCPMDTDGDGVLDYLDKCPDTPYQAYGKVDKMGCPKDTDGDGVPDYVDLCPKTPPAERNMVDASGCTVVIPVVVDTASALPVVQPISDSDADGDGIIDRLDKCPNVPGVASNQGCPEIKSDAKVVFQKAMRGIQFETAKYIIRPLSYVILDHVARVLSENKNYVVEIQGHTDNEGRADSNMTLSINRANAVRDYLISKGIEATRLTALGYGQTRPATSNATAAGRAINRRVEFVVTY